MSTSAAVIIPLYKPEPSEYDAVAISRCFDVLGGEFSVIAVKPVSLSLYAYSFPFTEAISFADQYFTGIKGYNELMLSASFYEALLSYPYILIHQCDAFVFRNELAYWCGQGYDYIGAPWFYNPHTSLRKRLKGWFHRKLDVKDPATGDPTEFQFLNQVGNGGFSLRNTERFHAICVTDEDRIGYYLSHSGKAYNEDCFWSLDVNRRGERLRIPSFKTALRFAVESNPDMALKYLDGRLPFGCHAWDRHTDYWKDIFRPYGFYI
jgi:hypothetical protein